MLRRGLTLCELTVLSVGLSLVGCTSAGEPVMGYEYRPVSEGKVGLYDVGGEILQELVVAETSEADCGSGAFAVEDGVPPHWQVGKDPGVFCTAKDGPRLYFYDRDLREAELDWPSQSGTYPGSFFLGSTGTDVDYDIELEEDRGNLTPIPEDGQGSKLEPTSSDYRRRYRVKAEVDCENGGLSCEGVWKVDILYEQSRDRVFWLYPTTE